MFQMLDTLPDIPLFQNLEPHQIAVLKPLFEKYTCKPNTTIFEQGEIASYLYYLIKGKVAIQYKPYDGPMITLTSLSNNSVFGWSAVIGKTHYTSSIVSETSVEAIRMKQDHLLALIRQHPETGKIIVDRLANIASSRLNDARAQVQSLLSSDQK